MSSRCDCEIAKVRHESITLPSEEVFDFHFMEPHCIECRACSDAQGVTRPHLQLFLVGDRIKVVEFGGRGAN